MIIGSSSGSIGRVAVVTGSNKGVGYFIALQLGLSGLFQHIILACRDSSRAATAVASIQAQLPSSVQVRATPPLALGDFNSHVDLVKFLDDKYGKVDCFVNNAAIAFKNADPTPFAQQTKPTLDVNFRGTVHLTEALLPLLRKGSDPRVVNVASMAGRLSQVSSDLQTRFASPALTMNELHELVNDFETSAQRGEHWARGYGGSNYGMSKLAVIAATKVLARNNPYIAINCCCPGYCKTDMSSQQGVRDPADGAKNAVLPATMENPPTGEFFADYHVSTW
jgi:carbonyl reductase 1